MRNEWKIINDNKAMKTSYLARGRNEACERPASAHDRLPHNTIRNFFMEGITETIRLAIADDHKIFRNGLISSLQPYSNLQIVCEADGGKMLLDRISQTRPDVVLLDMKMADMDGLEVCRTIRSRYPAIHVIGLSVYEHHFYIAGMFEAGASGYLLKDVDPAEIVKAIYMVYKDGSYMHDQTPLTLVKKLMEINHPSVYFDASRVTALRQHEIDILRLIASEHTNAEIAVKLNLSPKTVENYRNLLLSKTGAKNTAGLVTYAIKKGIILV